MKLSTLIASLLVQCVLGDDSNPTDCVKDFDPKKDYFPHKIKVDTATLFSIEYKNNYKILTNKKAEQTYVLYQCGTPKPQVDKADQIISIPVKKVAAIDTSSMIFLEMLGAYKTIKQVDTVDYISSPCVQKSVADKTIASISSTNKTKDQFADIDVIFNSGSPSNTDKQIIISAVNDPGTLQRTEWVEFYSTFFNLEDVANKASSTINDNYNCIKKNTASPSNGVTVAWTTYNPPFDGTPGYWSISQAPYKKQLTEDANAKFLTVKNETFSDAKDFASELQKADVIIDESFKLFDVESITKAYHIPADTDLPAFKNKKLFRVDGLGSESGGYDWYESAVPFQDAVLQDLVRILGTNTSALANSNRLWFRNVATEEKNILKPADCHYDDKPINSPAGQCKASTGSGSDKGKGTSNAVVNVAGWTFGLASAIVVMMI